IGQRGEQPRDAFAVDLVARRALVAIDRLTRHYLRIALRQRRRLVRTSRLIFEISRIALRSLSDMADEACITSSAIGPTAAPIRLWPDLRNSATSSTDQRPKPVRSSLVMSGANQTDCRPPGLLRADCRPCRLCRRDIRTRRSAVRARHT